MKEHPDMVSRETLLDWSADADWTEYRIRSVVLTAYDLFDKLRKAEELLVDQAKIFARASAASAQKAPDDSLPSGIGRGYSLGCVACGQYVDGHHLCPTPRSQKPPVCVRCGSPDHGELACFAAAILRDGYGEVQKPPVGEAWNFGSLVGGCPCGKQEKHWTPSGCAQKAPEPCQLCLKRQPRQGGAWCQQCSDTYGGLAPVPAVQAERGLEQAIFPHTGDSVSFQCGECGGYWGGKRMDRCPACHPRLKAP